MSKELIRLRDLCMAFDDELVLDHINLYINDSEFLTLLGPSGCGKTTTLRIIGGFTTPTSGDVTFDGERINDVPPHKRQINTVFQKYALFPHLDVFENIAFGLRIAKVPEDEIRQRVGEMLEVVSLKGFDRRRVDQLSGGQQQRIAIARSLLLKPSLLLLDEPFSALDAKIRQQMREELKKIQSDLGITVIFVTHDQEEAMALSHRIVVMNKGKFDQVGTPGEIYDSPATLHVASFIGEMNFIRNGGSTIAVRPEDIVVNKGHGPMEAVVRTIMMLGHYVVLTVQRGNEIIKCYVDRELSDQLREGDLVNLTIGKHTVFSQAA